MYQITKIHCSEKTHQVGVFHCYEYMWKATCDGNEYGEIWVQEDKLTEGQVREIAKQYMDKL